MPVSALEQFSTPAQSPSQPSTAKIMEDQKNQFLQLLITQLKNQDPFAPADSTQFAQQMMQMGQLEQLMNLNSSVDRLATAQQGALISQYSGLVGKSILASGSTFEQVGSQTAKISFDVPATPKGVEISIFDQFGNLKRTIDTGITASGGYTVMYDGKDSAGKTLPDGFYNFTVGAIDLDDNPILTQTYSSGRISSMSLDNGLPVFQMGRSNIGLSDIQKIF